MSGVAHWTARRPGLAKRVVTVMTVGLAVAAAWIAPEPRSRDAPSERGTGRLELEPALDASGFTRVTAHRGYRLPADHGPHFEYQTEWWYYTGNLESDDGRPYGFQLTFFRRGLTPGPPPVTPGLATNQVYFAHLAVTDVTEGAHIFAERWCRGAGGLAGARGEPFTVWLEDWKVESLNADGSAVRLRAHDEGLDLGLELELEALKPLARHGDRGVSRKSAEPGNASHYIGYTRLSARGRLTSAARVATVSGEAWFDHEWSTSALGEGAVGWDWFSLQLDDGRELMYFQIRRSDGSVERVSGGTLVERDGATRRLGQEDVTLVVLDRWTSPGSGAVYPARWRLGVPSEGLALQVVPRVPDQEMRTSFVYWEGSVGVAGTRRGRPLTGRGFVELTGYARSMQGVF